MGRDVRGSVCCRRRTSNESSDGQRSASRTAPYLIVMRDEERGNGKDDLQNFVIRREIVIDVAAHQLSSSLIGLYAFVKNDLECTQSSPDT